MIVERVARAAARQQQAGDEIVGLEAGIAPIGARAAPAPRLAEDRTRDVEDGAVHRGRLPDQRAGGNGRCSAAEIAEAVWT